MYDDSTLFLAPSWHGTAVQYVSSSSYVWRRRNEGDVKRETYEATTGPVPEKNADRKSGLRDGPVLITFHTSHLMSAEKRMATPFPACTQSQSQDGILVKTRIELHRRRRRHERRGHGTTWHRRARTARGKGARSQRDPGDQGGRKGGAGQKQKRLETQTVGMENSWSLLKKLMSQKSDSPSRRSVRGRISAYGRVVSG